MQLTGDRISVSHGATQQLLPRPRTYEEARYMLRAFFPLVDPDRAVFYAELEAPDKDGLRTEGVRLTTGSWPVFVTQMAAIRIEDLPIVGALPKAEGPGVVPPSPPKDPPQFILPPAPTRPIVNNDNGPKIAVFVQPENDVSKRYGFRVHPNDPLERLYDSVRAAVPGADPSFELVFKQKVICHEDTPQSLGIRDKDSVTLRILGLPFSSNITVPIRPQRVRKPVIYLFPPQPLQATVKVSLVPEWDFDVLYPVVPVESLRDDKQYHQSAQWAVDAQPDGRLVERATGLNVSYLFWEAKAKETQHVGEVIPPNDFVPGASICQPQDSVLLPAAQVPGYLERSLLALGLHTEARTSFITYWLSVFAEHEYIALRFVPQHAYEAAAPLEVSPKPDVVVRIFMVFQGVEEDQAEAWSSARERATEDVSRWKGVVGIDGTRHEDASLFRVVEWGGMDVTNSRHS